MDFVRVKRGRQEWPGEYDARKAQGMKGLGNTMGINLGVNLNLNLGVSHMFDRILQRRRQEKYKEYARNCNQHMDLVLP